jgi:hypothetical protein
MKQYPSWQVNDVQLVKEFQPLTELNISTEVGTRPYLKSVESTTYLILTSVETETSFYLVYARCLFAVSKSNSSKNKGK